MIKIQINAEGLKQSLNMLIDETINDTLAEINKKHPENIKNEEDFKKLFFELFPLSANKKLPKGFLDILDLKFNFKIDFENYSISIQYDMVKKK